MQNQILFQKYRQLQKWLKEEQHHESNLLKTYKEASEYLEELKGNNRSDNLPVHIQRGLDYLDHDITVSQVRINYYKQRLKSIPLG